MSCKKTKNTKEPQHQVCKLLYYPSGKIKLRDVYRMYLGKRKGQKVFVVDGDVVCRDLFPNFIMGGNDERYRFNPENEIWIDNRIGIEELEYTIVHELVERDLMRTKGWTYDRAHREGGLAIEKKLRDRDARLLAHKEKTILANVNNANLAHVYRQYVGARDGAQIWIVDGPKVRHNLYPDFCFGTHDFEHQGKSRFKFIPENEIWLDSAMSVEIGYYALMHQRHERRLILAGSRVGDAYDQALIICSRERMRQATLVARHELNLSPVNYGVRNRGSKSKT
jgi:hypothetical protein